jgi:hypothetical protein
LTSEVWKRSVGVIGLYVLIGIVFVLDEPAISYQLSVHPAQTSLGFCLGLLLRTKQAEG